MKDKVYPSLLYDTLRRATFIPTPSYFRRRLQNPQRVMNDFLCDLSAAPEPSFWFKCIKISYGDFDVTEKYVNEVFRTQFKAFIQSLHDLIENGHTGPYFEFPETRGQAASERWKALRRLLFTASIARRVTHLTDEGKKNFLLSHLWDLNNSDAPAMAYGRKNESNARKAYFEKQKEKDPSATIQMVGLASSTSNPELGCSIDSILNSATQCPRGNEFKCPHCLKNHDPNKFDNALSKEQLKSFYMERDAVGKIQLKEDSDQYYQVQMQMGILQLEVCDLVVWSKKGMVIIPVTFNAPFWAKLSQDLVRIHHTLLVPEYFLQRTPRDLEPVEIDLNDA